MPIRRLFMELHKKGYALAQRDGDIDAVYLPALNQVWLTEHTESRPDIPVLAHEFFHADACFLQPSMLHPLRNYLLDTDDRPTTKEFEDIVESLAAVILPILGGRPSTRWSIVATQSDYQVLAEQYLALARSLAHVARKSVRKPTVQALLAINFLLMHVRPFSVGVGNYSAQLLRRKQLSHAWSNRWELFAELHRVLSNAWRRSPLAKTRFMLAPPVDPHRCIGEMLIFLSGACLAVVERPNRVTHAVPSLLGIMSMGSLMVMPVVRISQGKNVCRARVSVVHSTRRGQTYIRQIIDLHDAIVGVRHSCGLDCPAVRLFCEILSLVKPFRASNSRTRLVDCANSLLKLLPQRIGGITRKIPTCPNCKLVLRDPAILAAAHHVAVVPPQQRSAILTAVEAYESWLLTRCVQDRVCGHPVRVTKAYRYL